MSKKSGLGGLGRGLDALFGENNSPSVEQVNGRAEKGAAAEAAAGERLEAAVGDIRPNPYQPRQIFDEEKLRQLADSLREHGVVEPLIVRLDKKDKKGRRYELVAGERRLRAAKLAGLKTVPVIVRDYTDLQTREIALVENINRHDLNPIEEAKGLRALMQECSLTQEQAAAKVGRSRVAVTNLLRLLNLAQPVQELITGGRLSMGQAKTLLALSGAEQQLEVAQAIVAEGWSARMTEEVVRRLKEGKKLAVVREVIAEKDAAGQKAPKERRRKEAGELDLFCRDFESQARQWLGTKVRVLPLATDKKGRTAGSIQIEYYSAEDLERLYELLHGREEAAEKKQPLLKSKAVKLNV